MCVCVCVCVLCARAHVFICSSNGYIIIYHMGIGVIPLSSSYHILLEVQVYVHSTSILLTIKHRVEVRHTSQ
jgi:hypothetical protein